MTYTFKLSRRLAAIYAVTARASRLALVASGVALSACAGGDLTSPRNPNVPDPARATPGWVSLNLVSPNTNDGAVRFSLTGGAVDSLQFVGVLGFASIGAGGGHFLLTGQVGSGLVARIRVPDTGKLSNYAALVEEVAARGTYQLQDVSRGYEVRVVR